MRRNCLIFACTCFALMALNGAEQLSTNQTTITSGRLTFDYHRYTAEFEKDVVVVDPNMKISCDKLNVIFDNDSSLKQAIAIGNVRLTRDDKIGTCKRAIFVAKTGEIMLIGDAQLKRGNDVVKGDKITFWTNEDRMECEPGTLVITPTKNAGLPVIGTSGRQ